MHTAPRCRPLFAALVLAALLLLAPWPAEAGWLADLWVHAGCIWDPDGGACGELVSTPAEGLILDPNGGASIGEDGTPTATESIDEGLSWDPNG